MSREFIAQKLKELRKKSGLTADEVGKLINKSGKTVNAWENNHGQPDAEILIALCDIYKVDDILAEFREMPNKSNTMILTNHEKDLVYDYRKHPEHQYTIDTILKINDNLIPTIKAARSDGNNQPIEIVNLPDLSKFEPDDTDL